MDGKEGERPEPQGPAAIALGSLAALARSGDIGDRHLTAADQWCRDWVIGVEGARDPRGRLTGKAPDIHARMLARVAARSRCSAVRQSLGRAAEQRLILLLVNELPFTEIGRRLLPGDSNSRKKIAAQTALLLELLAEHYETMRRSGSLTKT